MDIETKSNIFKFAKVIGKTDILSYSTKTDYSSETNTPSLPDISSSSESDTSSQGSIEKPKVLSIN